MSTMAYQRTQIYLGPDDHRRHEVDYKTDAFVSATAEDW